MSGRDSGDIEKRIDKNLVTLGYGRKEKTTKDDSKHQPWMPERMTTHS